MERKVYLILTDTGTLFTRMIKWYTKKPYNHASLSFDPLLLETYSFGRKRPRNPFIGGFVKESMDTGLFKRAQCAIYSCSITESQYRKMNDFIRKIEKQKEQYRYNFLGLLVIPFNKTLQREHAYFCSQFVATVLSEGQVIQCPKSLSHMTPYDLQQQPCFQLIYQGSVQNYLEAADMPAIPDEKADSIGIWMKKLWSACVFFPWL
jgi:hypothetical protein